MNAWYVIGHAMTLILFYSLVRWTTPKGGARDS